MHVTIRFHAIQEMVKNSDNDTDQTLKWSVKNHHVQNELFKGLTWIEEHYYEAC